MLDVLVIAYPKTLPLLKIMVESYLNYFQGDGVLHILIEKDSCSELSTMKSSRVRLHAKEDHFPDHAKHPGYLTQQYFKMLAHKIVEQPFYWVIDDDYLFVRKFHPDQYFYNGKPFWFLQDWEKVGTATRWKGSSEALFSLPSPYCFITTPLFILSREILAVEWEKVDFTRILKLQSFAEMQAYGALAFANYRDQYNWIDAFWGDEVFGVRANQPPPDFLSLDATMDLRNYSFFEHLQFWSHWSLAGKKMREFYQASLRGGHS